MKRDRALTESADFLDKRSYIGQRVHPGTDHQCDYLRGDDARLRRMDVFVRDHGRCQNCGAWYGWEWGEMHHLKGGLGLDRCWCMENLAWSCPQCHRSKHVQPMWSKR